MRNSLVLLFFRKFLELGISLISLAVFAFILLKALPGGPFDDMGLNPLVKEKLAVHWNVDKPWTGQIVSYFASLLVGDLGISLVHPDQTVSEIIFQGISNTFLLNMISICLIVILSILTAMVAVRFRDTAVGQVIGIAMTTLSSLPSLLLGPVLIYLFGFYLNVLPVALLEGPKSFILPVVTLSLRPYANLVRILKNSMNEVYNHDYVRTAIAKGAGPLHVLWRHVLKNSMTAFLSLLGPIVVATMSGSFIVEVLFAIPGVGLQFLYSINERDYTVILGLTLAYGAALLIINFIIDIFMKYLDPRLREEI